LKISIGLRLFASVLVAIIVVAAAAVALVRQNVIDSFGDYAQQIELDRLDQLSGELAARYAVSSSWAFIDGERSEWIARTLADLRQRSVSAVAPVAPPAPAAPAAPMLPAPAAPAAPAEPVLSAPNTPLAPPAPSEPVLPPLPPPALPPAPPAPAPPAPAPGATADTLALPERIALLDHNGAYLAGYRFGGTGARRPIRSRGQTVGYLAVARTSIPNDAMSRAFFASVRGSLWIIGAACVALSALAAMLLAAHFRQPIRELAGGARELAAGRYGTRLPEARSDELGELARAFNQLAGKLAAAEQSRRQWVADTSHELRTPLSVLRAQLEAIEDGVRPASADSVASMLRQVLALNTLVDDLYALARADVGEAAYQRQRIDLWQLAAGEAAAFAGKFDAAGLTFSQGAAPAQAVVLADPDRLRQVFTNLFENCVRYCGAGAHVKLHAQADGASLAIAVDDSGPGVPPEAMARLVERFFRVEQSRGRASGGAGLGLALCQRIVEGHGGQLVFSAAPAGGLRACVTLPLASA
jgi:two-component system sensor histidine kinase BaeS